jgi:hypothetical protein
MFRHHADATLNAAHAEVEALQGRLGHDISTLDDGGDATNRQALADASERYNTAGAQLGQAKTVEEIAVARSVVVEGLHSTRLVRTRLGLDPGPDPALVAPPVTAETHAGTSLAGHHLPGGLAGALGAGAAGGLLGILGGGILGEVLGGDQGGGGWGGDEGGWGGDDGGGGGDF